MWLFKPEEWPENIKSRMHSVILLVEEITGQCFERVAWIARFGHCARNQVKKTAPLTTEETEAHKRFWEERTQRQGETSEEYEADRMQLNLQLNQSGLLECRGRIQGHSPYTFQITRSTRRNSCSRLTKKHFTGEWV